ncbi:TPA: translation initiation factor IF-3 [Candidatus Poribacteria bacterium]|nr:translation initiation factor IF-3 [Candidatus Poribacteria bacterium]
MRKRYDDRKKSPQSRINGQIRARELRVVSSSNEQLGIITLQEALEIAGNEGLDLVEVAPTADPPVCKVMDYGKFQYEKSKREKEARKKQAKVILKEIQFRPDTADHDYQFKMRHAREFLTKGYKVRSVVRFRGRQMLHTNLGRDVLHRLVTDVGDVAEVELGPKMENNLMAIILAPKTS